MLNPTVEEYYPHQHMHHPSQIQQAPYGIHQYNNQLQIYQAEQQKVISIQPPLMMAIPQPIPPIPPIAPITQPIVPIAAITQPIVPIIQPPYPYNQCNPAALAMFQPQQVPPYQAPIPPLFPQQATSSGYHIYSSADELMEEEELFPPRQSNSLSNYSFTSTESSSVLMYHNQLSDDDEYGNGPSYFQCLGHREKKHGKMEIFKNVVQSSLRWKNATKSISGYTKTKIKLMISNILRTYRCNVAMDCMMRYFYEEEMVAYNIGYQIFLKLQQKQIRYFEQNHVAIDDEPFSTFKTAQLREMVYEITKKIEKPTLIGEDIEDLAREHTISMLSSGLINIYDAYLHLDNGFTFNRIVRGIYEDLALRESFCDGLIGREKWFEGQTVQIGRNGKYEKYKIIHLEYNGCVLVVVVESVFGVTKLHRLQSNIIQ